MAQDAYIPSENPDAFSDNKISVHSPIRKTGSDTGATKPKDARPVSGEDGDKPSDSPIRHEPAARRPIPDSSHRRHGDRPSSGDPMRRPMKVSGASDRREDHSPRHPHSQPKSSGRGGFSSPRERRGSLEGGQGFSPSTPGGSRFKTGGRGNETPEKISEVPKFGEWDKDPQSGEGYTGIFNIVAEERQGGLANTPIISNDSANGGKQDSSLASMDCCCFSWFKK